MGYTADVIEFGIDDGQTGNPDPLWVSRPDSYDQPYRDGYFIGAIVRLAAVHGVSEEEAVELCFNPRYPHPRLRVPDEMEVMDLWPG
jgi:hypothetical protein